MLRFDNFKLDAKKLKRTAAGGIRVSAYLSRTGLQTYRRSDGSEIIEYRPPEEVFSDNSLETFKGAPITDGHPSVPVDSSNWSILSKGHVSDSVSPAEDKFVRAELLIQDRAIIEEVISGDLSEISCGYECDLLNNPGEINGERYDAIQSNIRINHIALLPKGLARGGRELTVRFDSEGNQIMDKQTEAAPEVQEEVAQETVTEEINTDAANDENVDTVQKEDVIDTVELINKLSARIDALEKLNTPKEDSAEPTVDELVAQKLNVIQAAKKINPELTTDGLTNLEIKINCLKDKKLNLDSEDENYINGAFDILVQLEENKPVNKADSIEKKLDDNRVQKKQSGKLAELQQQWAGRLNKGAN